ncbi:efflux RND transporter periplasmic adaptor subunit [Alcanivorax nanhaiticus]|uniref:efflux RND transporter periplasmic adaptor subunit n=1 Tax=Alcanivorax nanhaiticus TaxID=1177154 RepID=UPI0009DF03D7
MADLERQLAEASSLIAKRSIAASEVRSLEAQVEAGKAALAASQADVGRQQALLARHTLKAPFSGVISGKLTEVGEWITPGTPVFDLVGTGQLHADFAVPQRYYSQISSQTALTVRQENAPSNNLLTDTAGIPATISAIVPVSDPSARTFILRASIDAEGLTPGMGVFGSLAIQSQQAEPVVPRDALLRDVQGNVSVWLAVEDEEHGLVAQRREIKVRPGQSDPVIVTDGLRQGDQVVIRGNESLREGDAVLVTQ